MIGLSLKFHEARLIRTMLNKALFRVEEVQGTTTTMRRKQVNYTSCRPRGSPPFYFSSAVNSCKPAESSQALRACAQLGSACFILFFYFLSTKPPLL